MLEAFPEMDYVHKLQISWGAVDSINFPMEIKKFKRKDFEHYFEQYDERTLVQIYDSIIEKAHPYWPRFQMPRSIYVFFYHTAGALLIRREM